MYLNNTGILSHFTFIFILTDDHSRVQLRSIPGQNKNIESYINGKLLFNLLTVFLCN